MKLIDKDAVVAEIEKLINEIYAGRPFDALSSGQQTALWYIKSIMSSINILKEREYSEEYDGFLGKELKMVDDEIARLEKLKVKEVALEKEMYKEWNKCEPIDEGMGLEIASIEHEQFDNIAKHFFELGIQVSNKV